jgi:RNA polymerase sigma factor for flagellar operon FliA
MRGIASYRSDTVRLVEGMSRDEVCRSYRSRVVAIARRVHERLSQHSTLGVDDLASVGALGLLEAFDRYDGARGVNFATFAEYRIRGAMYDALREVDPVSRRRRSTARQVVTATDDLRRTLGREPEAGEVAERLDMSLDDYWSVLESTRSGVHVSLDSSADPDGASLIEQMEEPSLLADDRMVIGEMRDTLRRAVSTLPERQRRAVLMYYGEGMNLAEIARVYDVTPSRVSQLITEARGRVRRALLGAVDLADLAVEVPG